MLGFTPLINILANMSRLHFNKIAVHSMAHMVFEVAMRRSVKSRKSSFVAHIRAAWKSPQIFAPLQSAINMLIKKSNSDGEDDIFYWRYFTVVRCIVSWRRFESRKPNLIRVNSDFVCCWISNRWLRWDAIACTIDRKSFSAKLANSCGAHRQISLSLFFQLKAPEL